MKLVKKGREITFSNTTFNLPDEVVMDKVRCDDEGHPCGNAMCCAVYNNPEAYPKYQLIGE